MVKNILFQFFPQNITCCIYIIIFKNNPFISNHQFRIPEKNTLKVLLMTYDIIYFLFYLLKFKLVRTIN